MAQKWQIMTTPYEGSGDSTIPGMEDMEKEGDETTILSSTGSPSIDMDETASDYTATVRSAIIITTVNDTSDGLPSVTSSSSGTSRAVNVHLESYIRLFQQNIIFKFRLPGCINMVCSIRIDSTGTTSTPTSTKYSHNNKTAMALTLPLVAGIFILLLVTCFILILWKKTLKRRKSKRGSMKTNSNEMKEELDEVAGKLTDTFVTEHCESSLKHCTDLDNDEERKEGAVVEENITCTTVQYAEVDENVQPIPAGNSPQNNNVHPPVNFKVGAQGSHGYEEAIVHGTHQYNQGHEEEKNTEERDVMDRFYHTLDQDVSSYSCCTSVSMSKQDGGYDNLDRQQNPIKPKSTTDSGYDMTKQIGKGDAIVGPSNQTGSDYSTISRSAADISAFDKLDHTRGRCEVVNISPNMYNVLQSQED